MKKIPGLFGFALGSYVCNDKTKDPSAAEDQVERDDIVEVKMDSLPRVTGTGGIFFFSEEPKEIKQWYGGNRGLTITDYGSTFEFRNANRPEEINYSLSYK